MHGTWKRLASLSTLALALGGCGGGNSGDSPQAFDSLVLFDPVPTSTAPNPCGVTPSAIIPFPFDGLFSGFSAPTLNIPLPDPANPSDPANSLVQSVNQLDGFSTVANIFFDVTGVLDFSTIPQHLIIVNSSTGVPLAYGTDFTIQPEHATAEDPLSCQQTPISSQRSRVLIELKKPLAPATRYLVAVTKGIRTAQGAGVTTSAEFSVVASATPVSQQTNPVLTNMSTTDKDTLEALRSQLIEPTVAAIAQAAGISRSDIVLAWPFSTQSIGLSLASLSAGVQPATIAVQATGITTQQALQNPALTGADIYAGILAVPYYLKNANASPLNPLTSFWLADATKPNLAATFLGQVPCGAFATGATVNGVTVGPSTSTTVCYPVPVRQSTEIIPLLVAVPNGASGQSKPPGGWPVVIFQHGITGNRTQMLPLAPALARAGFVTVAVDLPLHGLTNNTPNPLVNPFYRNQLFAGTPAAGLVTGERTFDLDLENNSTGASGPDGSIDPSGTWFINLSSLLTSRDNLRQAEADLMTLRASLANLDLDNNSTPDLDMTQVRFAGISLGSIVGIPFLANDTVVGAASLSVPGGGVAKLLDGSKSIGPRISAGLGAAGVVQGTDDCETFLRFAQNAVDDGDPLNYAVAARAAHPIHMSEVIGDTVVPNSVPASDGSSASLDIVVVPSFDAGTDPLYAAMGLTVLGPIDVPVAAPSVNTGADFGYVVKFNQGDHGSLLDFVNQAVTVEMQTETANFLASGGVCLPLGQNCP